MHCFINPSSESRTLIVLMVININYGIIFNVTLQNKMITISIHWVTSTVDHNAGLQPDNKQSLWNEVIGKGQ